MRSPVLAAAAAFGLLAVVPATASAADRAFAATGSFAVEVKAMPGSSTKVVIPKGAPAGTGRPLVVASHGFSASGDNQIGWAKHFASWGLVVAVPSFPSSFSPDHQANAKIIEDLVTDLTGPSAATYGVAPKAKLGLEGHSAGGLATTLAAAKISPDAVVLFDPVDNNDLGKPIYATLCAPTLGIFAGPSSCNNQAGWRPFATTTKGPLLAFDVKGSTHCDGENAARPLCATFCGGGASTERQSTYAHYATAFLLAQLTGDAVAKAALASADTDADLDAVTRTNGTCTSPVPGDGGASSSSSSSSGAASSSSGAPAGPSADPGDGDPAAPGAGEAGCGCTTPAQSAGRGALFALACLALGIVARRRHARN